MRFFDDDLGARFALTPDQARRYHRLTFTIDYDIPVQPTFDPLAPRPFLEDRDAVTGRPGVGGMMRVIWRTAAHRGGAFAVSCGLPVQDGGPRTYSIDLSAYAAADPGCSARACSSCRPAPPGAPSRSNLTNFRLDINEGTLDTPFTLANVKLAADDEPDAAGQFVVQWAAQDARYSAAATSANATVAIYVDTDTDPSSKRLVANNLAASAGAYIWDLAATPGGITPGTYQVYVEMTDAAGYSFGKYASGPLQVTRTYEAPMTLTQWQAFYGLTDMAADTDGDGVSNQAEFEAGTSPQIANRSELAEGSTGFFQERVAIANPENRAAIARVTVLFGQRSDLGEATPPAPIVQDIPIAAYGRYTVNVNALAECDLRRPGTRGIGDRRVVARRRRRRADDELRRRVGWSHREGAHGAGQAVVPRRRRGQRLLPDVHPADGDRQRGAEGHRRLPPGGWPGGVDALRLPLGSRAAHACGPTSCARQAPAATAATVCWPARRSRRASRRTSRSPSSARCTSTAAGAPSKAAMHRPP